MCPVDGYFDTAFGVDGDLLAVPDASQPDGSVSYSQGFTFDYQREPSDPLYKPVPRNQSNQIYYDITSAVQQYQQQATPPFITSTMNGGTPYIYSQFNRVFLNGIVYQSIADSNADTPPSSKWAVCLPGGEVGAVTFGISSAAPYGKLLLNADTIGSTTSGATHAGSQYQALYTLLWNSCSSPSGNAVAQVIGGLGASASADFAANKKLTLLTGANFSPMGVGSTITQVGATAGANTNSASGSISMNPVTLSTSNMPAHSHYNGMADDLTSLFVYGATTADLPGSATQTIVDEFRTVTYQGNTSTVGGGSAFTPTGSFTGSPTNIVHPVLGLFMYINYM